MTPEPVPPPEPLLASIVTTLGSTFVAIAVVWLTDVVSFTVTVAGPTAGFWSSGLNRLTPAYAPPRPAAPPTIAAATISPTIRPPPPDFCFVATGRALGDPAIGWVGCVWFAW